MCVANHSTSIQQVINTGLKAFVCINCSELLQNTNLWTYVMFIEDCVKHGFVLGCILNWTVFCTLEAEEAFVWDR